MHQTLLESNASKTRIKWLCTKRSQNVHASKTPAHNTHAVKRYLTRKQHAKEGGRPGNTN